VREHSMKQEVVGVVLPTAAREPLLCPCDQASRFQGF
jgi:hypothetical protein